MLFLVTGRVFYLISFKTEFRIPVKPKKTQPHDFDFHNKKVSVDHALQSYPRALHKHCGPALESAYTSAINLQNALTADVEYGMK